MTLYSTDNSIFINKSADGCAFDIKVNPSLIGGGGSGGNVLIDDTSTVTLQGNGYTVPLQAFVKVSAQSGNALSSIADGLYVTLPSGYTDAQARASISASTPLSYNSSTGVMSIGFAGVGQSGAITAADWSVFNGKVDTATNVGGGSGVFKTKSGNTLELRTIIGGSGIGVQQTTDGIIISSTGSSYTDANARAAISGVSPIVYNPATGVINILQGGSSQPGYITAADWTFFNNKVNPSRVVATVGPLTGGGNLSGDLSLGIQKATATTDGYLAQEDFLTLTNKQDAIVAANVTAGSSKVSLGGTPTGAALLPFSIDLNEGNILLQNLGGVLPISKGGSGQITAVAALNAFLPSQTGQSGKLLGTDGVNAQWVTGGGGTGGENPLTFSSPLTRVGDNISMPVATASVDGYLSASNFNFFSNKVGDGANLGTSGARVFSSRVGNNLEFRRIVAGTNVIIAENANDITITSTAGTGGSAHAINTTVSELKLNASAQTLLPYYITDVGQEGFFYYDPAGGATVSNGGATANSGTIIRAANGNVYRRSYNGDLDIKWFGGKADYVAVGTTMTGTNNTTAFNNMQTVAAEGQRMIVGAGRWYFPTPCLISNTKRVVLDVYGDMYAPGGGIKYVPTSVSLYHRVRIFGRGIGLLGLTAHNKFAYDSETGMNAPDGPGVVNWNSLTAYFIDIEDVYQTFTQVEFVEGYHAAIRFAGGAAPIEGGQENTVHLRRLERNTNGVLFYSTDGSSYMDKNTITGIEGGTGRIGGNQAIKFDGGPNDTGAFRSNIFQNILIEAANAGIRMTGDCTYNKFIGCHIEGGVNTGVFGPDKIWLANSTANAVNGRIPTGNAFIGLEFAYIHWLINVGTQTSFSSTPLFSDTPNFGFVGNFAIGGSTAGRITIMGSNQLSAAVRASFPSNIDYIEFVGTLINSGDAMLTRVAGVDRVVSYDKVYQNITSSTVLSSGITYARVSTSIGSVVLTINNAELVDGRVFYIDVVTLANNISIVRSSDALILLPDGTIDSTGIWLLTYVSANGGFRATKVGGGTSSGITSFGPVGPGITNGGSVSGSVATLHLATSVYPGLWGTGTQTLPGNKTLTGVITLSQQAGSGTRMLTVDSSGNIGNQAIPGGVGGSYVFSTGLAESGGTVTANLSTGAAVTTQYAIGSVNSGGNLGLRSTSHATKGRIIADDAIQLRANTTAANTMPLLFSTSSTALMIGAINGAMQFDATDLYITCQLFGTQKIATAANNLVFTNKTWNGAAITYGVGGTGLTTLGSPGQSYRVNAGGTGVEWYTPSGGGSGWGAGIPTVSIGPAGVTGSGGTIALSSGSTNAGGRITVTTGSGSLTSGNFFSINFSTANGTAAAPRIVVFPGNANASTLFNNVQEFSGIYSANQSGMEITGGSAAPGTTYIFNYIAVQT